MSAHVLLDTGPLIALLVRAEQHHDWAAAESKQLAQPTLTCEAVVSEACFILHREGATTDRFLQLFERKIVQVAFRLSDEMEAVARLMRRYADVPMSLADACLVRMSELYSDSVVWTLDSDFRRYRRNQRKVIPLLIPKSLR